MSDKKNYKTKEMRAEDSGEPTPAMPAALVCIRECVTPNVGKGTWSEGDRVTDAEIIKELAMSPFFKSTTEVK